MSSFEQSEFDAAEVETEEEAPPPPPPPVGKKSKLDQALARANQPTTGRKKAAKGRGAPGKASLTQAWDAAAHAMRAAQDHPIEHVQAGSPLATALARSEAAAVRETQAPAPAAPATNALDHAQAILCLLYTSPSSRD